MGGHSDYQKTNGRSTPHGAHPRPAGGFGGAVYLISVNLITGE